MLSLPGRVIVCAAREVEQSGNHMKYRCFKEFNRTYFDRNTRTESGKFARILVSIDKTCFKRGYAAQYIVASVLNHNLADADLKRWFQHLLNPPAVIKLLVFMFSACQARDKCSAVFLKGIFRKQHVIFKTSYSFSGGPSMYSCITYANTATNVASNF